MKNDKKHRVLKLAARASFLLLMFSLGFMQPELKISGISSNLTEIIFLAAASIFGAAIAVGTLRPRPDKVFWLFGLYLLALGSSAVLSENSTFSGIKLLGEIYLVGLAVLTFQLADDERFLKKIVLAWLAASSVTALVGVLTVVFFYLGISNVVTDFAMHHYGSLPPGPYPRIQGTFLYPSMLCNYLSVSLLMLFAARRLKWVPSVLFAGMLLTFAITMAFTVTPGLGGALLATGLWFWYVFRDQGRTAISRSFLGGGLVAAFLFQLVSTFSLINTPTSPYHFSLGTLRIDPAPRLLTWQGAFQTFLDHPLFGKGLGLGVATVYFQTPSGEMLLVTDAHNFVLSVAAQAGLFGACALILVCVAVARASRLFHSDDSELSILRVGLGIAFVSAFIVQGLVGSFENTRHLWVLIGMILAVYRLIDIEVETTA